MKTAVESDVLTRHRDEAAKRFEILGFPTTRQEEWKYTSLAALTKIHWRTLDETRAEAGATWHTLQPAAGVEITFVNGIFAGLTGEGSPAIHVTRLAEARGETVERHFGRYADFRNDALTALNTANVRDGAFVEIRPGAVVPSFIHIVYVGSGDGIASHPRNLIVVGKGSEVAIVETYVGTGAYFANAVTEIVAGDGSVVDHYKIACDSLEAFHIGTVQIHQERSSSVTSRHVAIGGRLTRNNVNVKLAGEGATLTLDGLFVGSGTQHIDNHTVIDHARPHAESLEMYKGILDQSARGIFDGTIIVRPDAQKTVSRQTNNNLLLSETAIVDSKPTLEIHNDDVKCNHGSTIGQLREEPLFYLRSRGIGEQEARNLLIYAFASEVVDRMKIEPVRETVRRAMFQQMPERLPERRGGTR
jgi:Fe-S cluster assembly protein SufD